MGGSRGIAARNRRGLPSHAQGVTLAQRVAGRLRCPRGSGAPTGAGLARTKASISSGRGRVVSLPEACSVNARRALVRGRLVLLLHVLVAQ